MALDVFGRAALGTLGTVFGELWKAFREVKGKIKMFKPIMEQLEATLGSLDHAIQQIEFYNYHLKRPVTEIEWRLIGVMREGEMLLLECSKIARRDYWRQWLYHDKLKKLDDRLARLLNADLQIQIASDLKQILLGVNNIVMTLGLELPNHSAKAQRGDMTLEPVGGVGFGDLLGELEKALMELKDKAAMFSPKTDKLECTLNSLAPMTKEIELYNRELNRPPSEIESLIRVIEDGMKLLSKCSRIRKWGWEREWRYQDELVDLDKSPVMIRKMKSNNHELNRPQSNEFCCSSSTLNSAKDLSRNPQQFQRSIMPSSNASDHNSLRIFEYDETNENHLSEGGNRRPIEWLARPPPPAAAADETSVGNHEKEHENMVTHGVVNYYGTLESNTSKGHADQRDTATTPLRPQEEQSIGVKVETNIGDERVLEKTLQNISQPSQRLKVVDIDVEGTLGGSTLPEGQVNRNNAPGEPVNQINFASALKLPQEKQTTGVEVITSTGGAKRSPQGTPQKVAPQPSQYTKILNLGAEETLANDVQFTSQASEGESSRHKVENILTVESVQRRSDILPEDALPNMHEVSVKLSAGQGKTRLPGPSHTAANSSNEDLLGSKGKEEEATPASNDLIDPMMQARRGHSLVEAFTHVAGGASLLMPPIREQPYKDPINFNMLAILNEQKAKEMATRVGIALSLATRPPSLPKERLVSAPTNDYGAVNIANVVRNLSKLCGFNIERSLLLSDAFHKFPNLMFIGCYGSDSYLKRRYTSLVDLLCLLNSTYYNNLTDNSWRQINSVLEEVETYEFDPEFIFEIRTKLAHALAELCIRADGIAEEIKAAQDTIVRLQSELDVNINQINRVCDVIEHNGSSVWKRVGN